MRKLDLLAFWLAVAALVFAITACVVANGAPPATEPNVMLVFGAEWCPACKAMEADITVLWNERWMIYHVDVDKQPAWAQWADIGPGQPLPLTVIATTHCKRLAWVNGRQSKDQLLGLLRGWNVQRRQK